MESYLRRENGTSAAPRGTTPRSRRGKCSSWKLELYVRSMARMSSRKEIRILRSIPRQFYCLTLRYPRLLGRGYGHSSLLVRTQHRLSSARILVRFNQIQMYLIVSSREMTVKRSGWSELHLYLFNALSMLSSLTWTTCRVLASLFPNTLR